VRRSNLSGTVSAIYCLVVVLRDLIIFSVNIYFAHSNSSYPADWNLEESGVRRIVDPVDDCAAMIFRRGVDPADAPKLAPEMIFRRADV
jgi:hypothetical protein